MHRVHSSPSCVEVYISSVARLRSAWSHICEQRMVQVGMIFMWTLRNLQTSMQTVELQHYEFDVH